MVSDPPVRTIKLPDAGFLERERDKGTLMSFDLDLTARCNNDCAHCYVNLSAGDKRAAEAELSLEEIDRIADEAVSMGAMWCLLTGGEPLLRGDFSEIYLRLKKKGLLVSVFTNGNLISSEHLELFKRYPPRDIEVSVYGVTEQTYEAVTRKTGSFATFMRGVESLLAAGIEVRFKAMALRSNVHELSAIAEFCRERTKDYFRFDPWLHLRYDGDERRNNEIKAERLSPEEFVQAEQGDAERFGALATSCQGWLMEPPDGKDTEASILFTCGLGLNKCSIAYDGQLRLCASLCHHEFTTNIRAGGLKEACWSLLRRARNMRSNNENFLRKCGRCAIINFCMWCPAHAHLETGQLDAPVDYFCRVAGARARMLNIAPNLGDMSNSG